MYVRRKQYAVVAGLLIAVILFILLTSPKTVPLALLAFPFFAIYVAIFLLIKLVMTRKSSSSKTIVITSGLIAAFPALLVIFQSIHQLTIKDVLIVFALVCVVAFYLARADFIE
jgi:hypothetical protein